MLALGLKPTKFRAGFPIIEIPPIDSFEFVLSFKFLSTGTNDF